MLIRIGAAITTTYRITQSDAEGRTYFRGFEGLNRVVDAHRLEPVIDRVFAFDEARSAYEYLASGKHLGKVVIALP